MKKIISITMSIFIIIIASIGLLFSMSFDEWLPLDVVIAILFFLNSMISYSKDNDGEANVNLIMPCIMIAAFFMHLTYIFWIIIDLAIIIVSIYSIHRVRKFVK